MKRRVLALVAVACACLAACSSSGGSGKSSSGASTSSTPTTAAPKPLEVMVTNDDGIAAPGIDAIVKALMAEPNVHVDVVAPATNQSGTGGKTTTGAIASHPAKTASGVAGTAVSGFPADTIAVALDQLHLQPNLVVSGINMGQNIGPLAAVSGTVGAAKAAAARGIPALALSQGIGNPPDYPAAVRDGIAWFEANRAKLADSTAPHQVTSINVPTCTSGEVGRVVSVPLATSLGSRSIAVLSCPASANTPPPHFTDDVDAFTHGYASSSVLASS